MTRILHVDAFAGIAGDMFVAALIHAGAPLDEVIAGVRALGVPGWDARSFKAARGAYLATRFEVFPVEDPSLPGAGGGARPPPQRLPPSRGSLPRGHGASPRQTSDVPSLAVITSRASGLTAPRSVLTSAVRPSVRDRRATKPRDEGHAHDHGHGHGHAHGHSHAHGHGDDVFPGQPSRAWRDIRASIEAAQLAPRVKARALRVFGVLAEAEARVHGMAPDDVTFHEVGAVDSIVDIVGACVALECLRIDALTVGPIPMGSGSVRTEHGLLPVPVPATVEVLRGFPVVASPFTGELVTPTGAAIVAGLATPSAFPAMRVAGVGYGAGKRDPATHANVLRVIVGDSDTHGATVVAPEAAPRAEADTTPTDVVELRANVDDLTGESVPGVIDALLAAGALDAWTTPISMKKGRPGLQIAALAAPGDRARVGDALLRHAGTFGYRWSPAPREVCVRAWERVTTPFGEVRVKVARRDGELLHAAPEHEDVAAAARAHGVPVTEVRGAALAAWYGTRAC